MPVIVGVGNLLMMDDGFGIHVVRKINEKNIFEETEVVDVMTNVGMFLNAIDGYEKAIVVDAISLEDSEPGDIHCLRLDPRKDEFSQQISSSLHEIHFKDFLKIAIDVYELPDEIIIIGVEPMKIQPGIGLSPECDSAVEEVIDLITDL